MEDNKSNAKKPYWLGHRGRLRRRVASGNPDVVRPYEIIETVLFYAVPRMDVSGIARDLIDAFGSVDAVLNADRERLMAVPGVTRRMADCLLATGELVEAYINIKQENQFRIWRFEDMQSFLKVHFGAVRTTQLWAIYTDHDERVVGCMKIADSLLVNARAREILENVLALEARYVYVAAFYGPEPLELYEEEARSIAALSEALTLIGVTLMDYLMIGEERIISLCMTGRMSRAGENPETARLRERYVERQ